MEAPRGVEPTGTNGRRRHSSPFPLLCVGVGPRLCCCWIVPGDNERWNGHEYDVDERFVSRPLAGSRTATVMMPEWFPFWSSVPFDYGFCGGHGPGVTPGPFPNPEAKAWHGDGTAPGRVWESNTPPQTFLVGFPVEPTLRETPPFFVSGDSSAPVPPHGSSPTGSQRGFPGSPLRIPIQTKRKTPLLRSLHI